jgi:hypothetical protein
MSCSITRIIRRPGDRVRHFDPEHLAIAFVDEIECPERSPAVERIRHEVQRPDLVQSAGSCQGLTDACRQAPLGSARKIELHGAVHPMQAFVVDATQ